MVRRNRENTGKDNMLRGKEDVHRKVEYEKLEKGISLVPNPLVSDLCQLESPTIFTSIFFLNGLQ